MATGDAGCRRVRTGDVERPFLLEVPVVYKRGLAFVSVGRLVKDGGLAEVAAFYRNLGSRFADAFADMLMFDALFLNTDRHFGNLGVLVDGNTNKIVAPAPLFNHGCSLLFQAMKDDFDNLDAYAATQIPRAYMSFIDTARRYMCASQIERLRAAQDFRFKRHTRYNWPAWRLEKLEELIRSQADKLLR